MKWKKGRQEGGYQVLTLFVIKRSILSLKGLDCHIIRYRKSNYIPEHTDPVEKDKCHYRLNIVLWQCVGGRLYCDAAKRYLFGRIIFFRPDIMKHAVSLCFGIRYVLSIGWVK